VLTTFISLGLLVAGCAAAARAGLLIVTVRGDSMAPAFHHGDRVLAIRRRVGRVRQGAVVVAHLPETVVPERRLLKRVAALPGEIGPDGVIVPPQHVFLVGDGKGSVDSRDFGPVAADSLIGTVVMRLRRPT
jgi:signal peptidase I